jgi:hypothetical protein
MTRFTNSVRGGRPRGSPLQRAILEDAAFARPSNVMTLVDALRSL